MKRRKLLTALFLLLAVCALALGIAAVRRAQRLPSRAGVRAPVLMYHAVGDDCWGEESLFVKPEELEKQLQYLSENGYETIFFEDLSHIEQYEKPVLLTFDDGYDDNAETLLPLLQKYGMKATIFAIGVSFGTDHYKDTDYAITPHFGAAEAAEMTASGLISIQSHTHEMHKWPPYETGSAVRENILQLPGESEEAYVQALTEDFTRSRALLEGATGQPVDVLAYPAGQYSTLAQVTLQSLGVHVTLSTNPGVNTVVKGLPQTLYAMLRFGITEEVTPEALLDMIR